MRSFISTLANILPLAAAAPLLGARDSSTPGCSDASFNNFAWAIEDFDYHASYIFTTPAHQNSWGYVNFNLTNPALGYEAKCSAASNQLSDFFYGTMAYTCSSPEDNTETTFDFSRPSGLLHVNQSWVCSDADPQYPTTFHAYGSVNLTLECTDNTNVNPDWELGQIYSDREVKCNLVNVPLKPSQISAVA
ncbi:hypothetical protein F5X96DRAFT_215636 [Biscogniauxia mediterranea]|nr:hypothetical protein F5X96DRAFT_215636 [Biscogniauxia mediterranea]